MSSWPVAIAQHDWMRDALCREYPNVNFFPNTGEQAAPAKSICARCIVRDECLDYGLNLKAGIFGGLNWPERDQLRRGRILLPA